MNDMKKKYDHCMEHVGKNVQVQMADNNIFMGFLESVDEEHVYLLVQDDAVNHNHGDGAYGGYHHGGHHHGGHHQGGHHQGGHHNGGYHQGGHHQGGSHHHNGGHHQGGYHQDGNHSNDVHHHGSQHYGGQYEANQQPWMHQGGHGANGQTGHMHYDVQENMRTADPRIFGGFGPGYGYGYGPGPFYGGGRFRRIALPLAGLAALSLLF